MSNKPLLITKVTISSPNLKELTSITIKFSQSEPKPLQKTTSAELNSSVASQAFSPNLNRLDL